MATKSAAIILALALMGLPEAGLAVGPYPELNPASFLCPPRNGAGAVSPGRDLFRIPVNQAIYPDSKCNDGTGAIFYVRRATNEADVGKWHIHLQGGGACSSAQSCANRWCQVGGNFGANKMSSQGAPAAIRGLGIFSRKPANSFAGWNHVFVYYCSSDSWSGQQLDKNLDANDPSCAMGVNCPVQYRIHFRGAVIVDAVRNQLEHACSTLGCPTPSDYSYVDPSGNLVTMPDLDDATLVVLSGSSAGSSGVRTLADQFGVALDAANTHGPGSLDFRAVLDAGIGASLEGMNFDEACLNSGFCTCASTPCSYTDYMSAFDATVGVDLRASREEGSCEAWHADSNNDPLQETWRCADDNHVAMNHLTTPFFVRQDLQDELLMRNFSEPDPGFGTCRDFGDIIEAQLNDLFATSTLDQEAEEGSASTGVPLATPGVFGPQRHDHESIATKVFMRKAMISGGAKFSFHDVLSNWIRATPPMRMVTPFQPGVAAPSYCP